MKESMYGTIKNVINTGNYELSDMLNKIDSIWLQGGITDVERAELIDYARAKAEFANSIDIYAKLEEMDKRIKALEDSKSDEDPDVDPEPADEYPPYVPGKWCYNGDKCSEDGKNYICTAPENVVCVWSPSEYPPYWQEVTE